MTEVVFDVERFREVNPAFKDEMRFTDAALSFCFEQAVEIIGNDDACPIPYAPDETPAVMTRSIVLNLLTCHIATQNLLWDPTQAGPVMSAAEGSVNASFGTLTDPANPAWWTSTRCGAAAWQIAQRYATGPVYFGVEHFYSGG